MTNWIQKEAKRTYLSPNIKAVLYIIIIIVILMLGLDMYIQSYRTWAPSCMEQIFNVYTEEFTSILEEIKMKLITYNAVHDVKHKYSWVIGMDTAKVTKEMQLYIIQYNFQEAYRGVEITIYNFRDLIDYNAHIVQLNDRIHAIGSKYQLNLVCSIMRSPTI
jgi:hypothetical protein